MCHAHVDELGNELLGRRLSDQKPHLLKGVGGPGEQDEKGNEDGTDGVQIPHKFVANDGHDQAEDVDDDVVSVINKKDADRWEPAVKEAIHHQAALEEDCNPVSPARKTAGGNQGLTSNAHKHQRDDLEFLRVSWPAAQVPARLNLEGSSALPRHVSCGDGLTKSWTATVVIKAQNKMMPSVSILFRPTGNLYTLGRAAMREVMSMMNDDTRSMKASAAVANSCAQGQGRSFGNHSSGELHTESDPVDMAAYI